MPLISPPPNQEKLPFESIKESPRTVSTRQLEHDRIQRFLDCPNWICYMRDCGAVNFGRNKKCAYCWGRLNRFTERPINYMEPPL